MELSSLTDSNGFIKIAAFDHRDSLGKILPEERMSDFKALCSKLFSPYSTAILVDPEYGEDSITIAKDQKKGILLSRAKSGYADNPDGRKTVLYKQFTSQRLKEMGATGIKLLVYYNASADNANEQVEIVKKVHEEAKQANLPFLIEPITYPVDGHQYHRGDATLRCVVDLRNHCDILKLEYPVDPAIENIENAIPYLEQISSEAMKPWVLLSRGMKFDKYKKALRLSKEAGCAGFAVGRAVWQEFSELSTWEEQVHFMETTAVNRMKELSDIWN